MYPKKLDKLYYTEVEHYGQAERGRWGRSDQACILDSGSDGLYTRVHAPWQRYRISSRQHVRFVRRN